MAREGKEAEPNPFDIGQITERLPPWELFEDGIEPADDEVTEVEHDRAA